MSELNKIVLKIISNGKGILAADESNGTMTKRLEAVNIASNSENRLLFREILFSSESMRNCIGGVILYDETINQTSSSGKSIPDTYVPARNTIFLTHAMAWAEIIQCQHIFIGASSIDYSGYPDCRPEYIEAFENLANLATKSGVNGNKINIHAPLLHLSKAQTIQLGTELGVDYSQTVSCYQADPLGRACGACDSCYLRQKGFIESKIPDPTIYQN